MSDLHGALPRDSDAETPLGSHSDDLNSDSSLHVASTGLNVPSFDQLNPYATIDADASHETRHWQPVRGLSSSKESLFFRRGVDRVLQAVYEETTPSELEIRASTPEFTVHEDDWVAHSKHTKNQFALLTPLKTIARIPKNFIDSDDLDTRSMHENDISGYMRRRGERSASYRRRYLELNGWVLSYYRRKPEKDGVPLSPEEKKALERGAMDLERVSSMQPVDPVVDNEPYGIRLVTGHRTWSIAAESEPDYERWLMALCRVVKFTAIHETFRRKLQLQEAETAAVLNVRMVVATGDTVEEIIEHIFNCYTQMLNAPTLRPYDAKEYVLKVTGYRDFMIDRLRALNEYVHVRECLLTKKTLYLTVVHESLVQEMATRSLSIRTDSASGSSNQPLDDEHSPIDDDGEDSLDLVASAIPSGEVRKPFAIKIHRVLNIPRHTCVVKRTSRGAADVEFHPLTTSNAIVRIELFDGGRLLERAQLETVGLKAQSNGLLSAEWEDPVWHNFDMNVCDLVRTMRVQLSLIGVKPTVGSKETETEEEKILVAGVNVFQVDGVLTQGTQYYRMLDNLNDCSQGTIPHVVSPDEPLIQVDFSSTPTPIKFDWSKGDPESTKDVVLPVTGACSNDDTGDQGKNAGEADDCSILETQECRNSLQESAIAELRRVIVVDPLRRLSPDQKTQIWSHREEFIDIVAALPRVLSCADWTDRQQAEDAIELLPKWAIADHPAAYIALLNGEFSNETVRSFAVDKIGAMRDTTLSYFLPQLVQALKYENHILSPLAMLLVERAIKNPNQIGFTLFWSMKVESHHPRYKELYGTILNSYLDVCSRKMRAILQLQDKLFAADGLLDRICQQVKSKKAEGSEEMKRVFRKGLRELNEILPSAFQLPIDSRIEVGRIIVEKCRVMDQAKKPLWLVFENAEAGGEPVTIIFKSGDDTRQESLTLQLITLMDEMWRDEGLDLAMEPYRCVLTSPMTSIVEVVKNSVTTAEVHRRVGMLGAYRDPSFSSWIDANNSDRLSKKAAVERFTRSCAGYCVASYVLGIGGRHNDNMMITTAGRFFHVDFDHFLGHHPYNVHRKRMPFAFTHEMADVLGGIETQEFRIFVDTCTTAFNVIRKHMHLLVSLLLLMVPADLPELPRSDDIQHVVTTLDPELTEDEATAGFTEAINVCLGEEFKRIDNAIHVLAHLVGLDDDKIIEEKEENED